MTDNPEGVDAWIRHLPPLEATPSADMHAAIVHAAEAARLVVAPADTYDSLCGDTSMRLIAVLNSLGIPADWHEGAWRDSSHAYVVLFDGTIIDPTLDQFYPGGRGNTTGDWTADVWATRDTLPAMPRGWKVSQGYAWISFLDPFSDHYDTHRFGPGGWDGERRYWPEGEEPVWWGSATTARRGGLRWRRA